EGDALAQRLEAHRGRRIGVRPRFQLEILVEVEARPICARERPLVLLALDEAIDVPHLELDAGSAFPVSLALEEMIEEAKLKLAPIIGVEVRPVLDAVDLEPLLFRRGAHEALEVAARMQPLPAPVRRGEKRRGELGRAGAASARQLRGLRARRVEREVARGPRHRALDALLHRLWARASASLLQSFPQGRGRLEKPTPRPAPGAARRSLRRAPGER